MVEIFVISVSFVSSGVVFKEIKGLKKFSKTLLYAAVSSTRKRVRLEWYLEVKKSVKELLQ